MSPGKRGEEGASAAEYGLIVFAIAALITVIVLSLGGVNREVYSDSCKSLKAGYDAAGYATPSCT